jgi:hypothetical protein
MGLLDILNGMQMVRVDNVSPAAAVAEAACRRS